MKYIFIPVGVVIMLYMAAPLFSAYLVWGAVCGALYGAWLLLKFLFWPSTSEDK